MPGVGHKRKNMRHRQQVTLLQLSETIEPQLNRHQTQQEKYQKMGNVPDHAESFDAESTTEDTILPQQEDEKENQDPEQEPEQTRATNLMYHLYSYRQQLSYKKHHVIKMVTTKLLLTEELLKLQPIKHNVNTNPTSSWEDDFELSLLSDDELDDDDDDELELNNDPLVAELTHLKNYRKYLRNLIVDVATEKLKKCNKKKLKRLKRRTLISSKKPSKKKKGNMHYENWEQNQEELPREQNQEEPAEVIVID